MRFLTILLVVLLSRSPVPAMEVAMFDDMAAEDQLDYITYLVRKTRALLNDEGRSDLADRVDELFRSAGGRPSDGERQFRDDLDRHRVYAATAAAKGITITAGGNLRPVESVFVGVLRRNGVGLTFPRMRRLADLVRERPFWPSRPLRVAPSPALSSQPS